MIKNNGKISYLNKEQIPVCPVCNMPMYLDDVDYDFQGKQDEYWCCDNLNQINDKDKCYYGAFVKVRYGKVCKIEIVKGE